MELKLGEYLPRTTDEALELLKTLMPNAIYTLGYGAVWDEIDDDGYEGWIVWKYEDHYAVGSTPALAIYNAYLKYKSGG